MKIYKKFSKYIINSFFTNDKKNEFASVIIDKQYMEEVAHQMELSKDFLIEQLCLQLFILNHNLTKDIDAIISIVALQLYAASECESDGQYTAAAYNPRLCKIINYKINDLQTWYSKNQEGVWKCFYKWCTDNNFIVHKCQPKDGKNKHIQYPLELANYCFNREDFKHIVSVFNRNNIQPNEDIFYNDFWSVIDIKIDFQKLNKHIQTVFDSVLEDTHNYDIVKTQIYNHYLVWDGEDIISSENSTKKAKELYQIHLSDKNKEYKIDIRKKDGSKVTNFLIGPCFSKELSKYYSYKRSDIIIFQRDGDGDPNYWDETRFITNKEESGLAIVFNNSLSYKFHDAHAVFHSRNLVIYEFRYNDQTKKYYSDSEQVFEFVGGLRVTHGTYLVGGEPILRLREECTYLMNGEVQTNKKGDYLLPMSVGIHSFKFPKSRELKIRIVPQSNRRIKWDNTFCKWDITQWMPSTIEEGIVGLDFSHHSKADEPSSILEQWAKAHKDERIYPKNNVSLILLNNINKYE